MSTLVVTDLDGTIWDTTLVCHAEVTAAVHKLQQNDDVTLLAATGRRRNSARSAMAKNDFVLPAVLLNGSVGYDFASESLFHQVSFSRDDLAGVLEILQRCGVGPVAYLADTRAIAVSGVTTSDAHLASLGEDLVWSTFEELATSEDVLGMSMLGVEAELVQPAMAELEGDPRAAQVGYSDHLYPPFSFMIAPPDVSKVAGIEAFCGHSGLRPERIVALGDGGNDLEMLAMADVALVVDDADPRALALADVVIPRPEHGGWAQVLDFI